MDSHTLLFRSVNERHLASSILVEFSILSGVSWRGFLLLLNSSRFTYETEKKKNKKSANRKYLRNAVAAAPVFIKIEIFFFFFFGVLPRPAVVVVQFCKKKIFQLFFESFRTVRNRRQFLNFTTRLSLTTAAYLARFLRLCFFPFKTDLFAHV